MFGVMYFGVGLLYLLVSLGLGWVAFRSARARGISGWKWGLPVIVVMYLLVFWDWIPMEISYRNDCAKHAGFTLYTTLDEWKKQHPGVAETLVAKKNAPRSVSGDRVRYQLNQRFAWEIVRTAHLFHVMEKVERIVDTRTGEVLARYIDFYTDIPPLGLGIRRSGAFKIWMMRRSCEMDGHKVNRVDFYKFKHVLQDQGK